MKARLTKRTIDAAKPNGKATCFVWDTETTCFGVRIYPSGRKSFVCTYRVRGKQRFQILGRYGVMTLDEARAEAREVLARVHRGEDPLAEKLNAQSGPTMAELADRYMKEHAELYKKPRSARRDRQAWDNVLLPRFGKRKVADMQREDVAALHAEYKDKPIRANDLRRLLSKSFNLAEVWRWRPEGTNPCRHVKRYKDNKRERYLSEEELGRLGRVLAEAERSWNVLPQTVAAFRLLILTGCRSAEIKNLSWKEVDLEQGVLRLSDSKTGKKSVRLNRAAIEVLKNLEREEGSPWVIPGSDPQKPRSSLQKVWDRICREAELENLNIHDLRHTFASIGINRGVSLSVIGKLLGHRKITTTERYAHLADDPVRAANEEIGGRLLATLAGSAQDDEEGGESAAA